MVVKQMSEKRFKLSKYVTPSSVSNFCDENGRMLNKEVVKVLNDQQATITALKEENEQLRQKLDFYLLDEFEWKEKYSWSKRYLRRA